MKAVGLYRYLPIDDPEALLDLEIDKPQPAGRDLLVKVHAIAVNPVDFKIRSPKPKVETVPRVLGWDAAGVVESVGPECRLFGPGDAVYYSGSIIRPGANSEYHLVDERIVGRKPSSLSFAEAAALPLTTITVWEGYFDRMGISPEGRDAGKTLLIVGGAGGVGSIGIQVAKKLAGLRVVATASRSESRAWCRQFGADDIVNHFEDIPGQLQSLGLKYVDYILCANDPDQHFAAMAKVIAPQGKICSVVETTSPVDLRVLMNKSATWVWEFMFARALYQTPDMTAQHELLGAAAALIDDGTLRTTVSEVLGPINAANLRIAHRRLEEGSTVGKLVLEGF